MTNNQEWWYKDFVKLVAQYSGSPSLENFKEFANFMRSVATKEREEGRKEVIEEIKDYISWLDDHDLNGEENEVKGYFEELLNKLK